MEVILGTLIDGPILNSVLWRKHSTRIWNTASSYDGINIAESKTQSRKYIDCAPKEIVLVQVER